MAMGWATQRHSNRPPPRSTISFVMNRTTRNCFRLPRVLLAPGLLRLFRRQESAGKGGRGNGNDVNKGRVAPRAK
jgi:hypothetical protein